MVYGTQTRKHVLETDELGGYIKAIDNVAGNKWSSADFDSLVLVPHRGSHGIVYDGEIESA